MTVGLTANFARIKTLEAIAARVGALEADHVSAGTISSINGQIGNIQSDYISASVVKSNYMEIATWTNAGKIKADKIDVASLWGSNINITGHIGIASIANFSVDNRNVGWININIGTNSYKVLGEI